MLPAQQVFHKHFVDVFLVKVLLDGWSNHSHHIGSHCFSLLLFIIILPQLLVNGELQRGFYRATTVLLRPLSLQNTRVVLIHTGPIRGTIAFFKYIIILLKKIISGFERCLDGYSSLRIHMLKLQTVLPTLISLNILFLIFNQYLILSITHHLLARRVPFQRVIIFGPRHHFFGLLIRNFLSGRMHKTILMIQSCQQGPSTSHITILADRSHWRIYDWLALICLISGHILRQNLYPGRLRHGFVHLQWHARLLQFVWFHILCLRNRCIHFFNLKNNIS